MREWVGLPAELKLTEAKKASVGVGAHLDVPEPCPNESRGNRWFYLKHHAGLQAYLFLWQTFYTQYGKVLAFREPKLFRVLLGDDPTVLPDTLTQRAEPPSTTQLMIGSVDDRWIFGSMNELQDRQLKFR